MNKIWLHDSQFYSHYNLPFGKTRQWDRAYVGKKTPVGTCMEIHQQNWYGRLIEDFVLKEHPAKQKSHSTLLANPCFIL